MDRVRLAVYPFVGVLALLTVGARAHWFGGVSATGSVEANIVLYGRTAQGEQISVSIDHRNKILALQTTLGGTCDSGGHYQIGWSPNSPRILFAVTPVGVVARESTTHTNARGVASTITAMTVAHLRGQEIIGDARYQAVFHYPNHAVTRCDSGYVHWSVSPEASKMQTDQAPRFGGWAGYLWRGPVRTVSAEWSVPQITRDSSPGVAATWIAAEAPASGRFPKGEFIQVGLNEVVNEDEGDSAPPYYDYWAFWTNTAHGFHPLRLFTVSPGDRIVARLTLRDRRWIVSIRDSTSGLGASFLTSEDTAAAFSEAEWLQENPFANEYGDDEYMYPQLSRVVMRRLEVNSEVPAPGSLESQWMSEDGEYVGPSSVRHDAFSIGPVTLSRAGGRYLSISTRASRLLNDVTRSSSLSAVAAKPLSASSRGRLVEAWRATMTALRAYRWPRDVQPLITTHIGELGTLVRLTRAGAASARVRPLGSRWLAETQAATRTTRAIRRALHLPDRDPVS